MRGDVVLRLRRRNWHLFESLEGGTVHVVIDDGPYIELPTSSAARPISLTRALAQAGRETLEPGSHTVAVFLALDHFAASTVSVVAFDFERPTDHFAYDAGALQLVLNQPAGCQPSGQDVAVDFIIHNLPSQLHPPEVFPQVELVLDGQVRNTVDAPQRISDLSDGEHVLDATLLDTHGARVPGSLGHVTRHFAVGCPQ